MGEASCQVMDIEAIKAVIPHRYPFLLLDRVIELVPGQRIVAIKNVTNNEPFFAGHFPGHPVMPGVLIVEGMAQAGAVMMLQAMPDARSKVPLFAGIDGARFRRQVIPGDRLRFELSVLKQRGPLCRLAGKAFVEDELAAEAEITAVVGERGSR